MYLWNLIIKNKQAVYLSLILVVLFIFAWRKLPQLILIGDSFDYFVYENQVSYWKHIPQTFGHYWVSALVLGKVLPSLFSTNFSYYYYFELAILGIISVLFFWLCLELFKDKLVAFLTSIIFSINYFGQWGMIAEAIYPYFLERVLNLIFLIPSFLALHWFITKKNKKYYILSLLLFAVGVGLAHWNVLFTPLYMVYLTIARKNGYILSFAYLFISIFFLYLQESFAPGVAHTEWGFIEFALHPEIYNYPQKIILQLTYLSQYPVALYGYQFPFGYTEDKNLVHYIANTYNAQLLAPFVVLIYIAAGIISWYKSPKLRNLLIVSIVTTISLLYCNAYFGVYRIETESTPNRYLYSPILTLALFWGIFLFSLFRISSRMRIISVIVICCYYLLSLWMINENFKLLIERQQPTKLIWDEIFKLDKNVNEAVNIVLPIDTVGEYEKDFANDQYGKYGYTFYLDRDEKTYTGRTLNIIYSKECKCAFTREDI